MPGTYQQKVDSRHKIEQPGRVCFYSETDHEYRYVKPQYTNETEAEIAQLLNKPQISSCRSLTSDRGTLRLAIKSVESQWYKEWDLCIVDDSSSNTSTLKFLNSIRKPEKSRSTVYPETRGFRQHPTKHFPWPQGTMSP